VVALAIGTIELAQVFATKLDAWPWLQGLDFGKLGYVLVALFVVTWLISVGVWKAGRIEERWMARLERG
jgi:high-affinity nickel-transport protein